MSLGLLGLGPGSAFLAETGGDELLQRVHDLKRFRAAGGDADRVSRTGGKHHQAHDRCAADLDAVLLDMDRGVEAAGELDEFRRGARMQAALVDDRKLPGDLIFGDLVFFRGQRVHLLLRSWLATLMYLRPAACASSSAAAMLSPLRIEDSLISIGRFMPAITSVRPDSMTEMA